MNKTLQIKIGHGLRLEDAIQRIEHEFDLTNARLDRIIFLLEKVNE